jgi:hypothetical protein
MLAEVKWDLETAIDSADQLRDDEKPIPAVPVAKKGKSADARPIVMQPYEARKAIVIVPTHEDRQSLVDALNAIECPLRPIVLEHREVRSLVFSGGGPQEYLIYIGHPMVPKLYFPAADFHRQLFESKKLELANILRSLGAIEYSFKIVRGFGRQANGHIDGIVPIKGGKLDSSFQAEYKGNTRITDDWGETLAPSGPPMLPKNLIWYSHEPNWQVAAEGRLHYNSMQQNWSLVYESDFGITANAVSTLNLLKLKLFQLKIGGEFRQFEKTEWQVAVKYS